MSRKACCSCSVVDFLHHGAQCMATSSCTGVTTAGLCPGSSGIGLFLLALLLHFHTLDLQNAARIRRAWLVRLQLATSLLTGGSCKAECLARASRRRSAAVAPLRDCAPARPTSSAAPPLVRRATLFCSDHLIAHSCADKCSTINCGAHGTCNSKTVTCTCAKGAFSSSLDHCAAMLHSSIARAGYTGNRCQYTVAKPAAASVLYVTGFFQTTFQDYQYNPEVAFSPNCRVAERFRLQQPISALLVDSLVADTACASLSADLCAAMQACSLQLCVGRLTVYDVQEDSACSCLAVTFQTEVDTSAFGVRDNRVLICLPLWYSCFRSANDHQRLLPFDQVRSKRIPRPLCNCRPVACTCCFCRSSSLIAQQPGFPIAVSLMPYVVPSSSTGGNEQVSSAANLAFSNGLVSSKARGNVRLTCLASVACAAGCAGRPFQAVNVGCWFILGVWLSCTSDLRFSHLNRESEAPLFQIGRAHV